MTRRLILEWFALPAAFFAAMCLGGCIRELHVHIFEGVGKQRVEATSQPTTRDADSNWLSELIRERLGP